MTDHAARRHSTAVHEAAHAVAELYMGGTVEFVSIRPSETFQGIERRVASSSQPALTRGYR